MKLDAHKSAHYNSFVTRNKRNERIFSNNLTDEKKTQLFNITHQALDPTKCNLEFITRALIDESDGLKLWSLLEQRFQTSPKNDFDKDDLRNEFKSMKQGVKETSEDYLKRVEKKIAYLDQYDIHPTAAEQVVVLLEGMASSVLLDPVVQLRTGQSSIYSDWIKPGDLKHTMQKALQHIKTTKRINEKIGGKNMDYKQAVNNPSTQANATTSSKETTPPPTTTSTTQPTFVKRSDKFKTALMQSSNKAAVIIQWWKKKVEGCSLHPKSEDHKFLQCHHVRNICADCDSVDALATVIAQGEQALERGTDPEGGGARARRMVSADQLHTLVQAKRAQQQQFSNSALPMETDYDTDNSASTVDDKTKSPREPYSPHLNLHICSNVISKLPSILKPPQSFRTPQKDRQVHFNTSVTQQQLIKSNMNVNYTPNNPTTSTTNKACTNSGCTNDMSELAELFEYIIPLHSNKYVTLGDDKTTLIIKGYGMMNYLLNGKRIRRFGYYVPGLGITLLSIKQHIKYKGCYFHAENDQVILAYPKAVLFTQTDPEFLLDIAPAKHLTHSYAFDEEKAIFSTTSDKRTLSVLESSKARYINTQRAQQSIANSIHISRAIHHAKEPTYEPQSPSLLSVHAAHPVTLQPLQTATIHTGVFVKLPQPITMKFILRQALQSKGVTLSSNGDSSFSSGEIMIHVTNNGNNTLTIKQGQRVADCTFYNCTNDCIILPPCQAPSNMMPLLQKETGPQQYHSSNKELAIASALRVAYETHTQSMANSLHDADEDENSEFMKSAHEPLPQDGQNKPHDKSTYFQKYQEPSQTELPPTLPQDRVNSSEPKHVSFSKDFIIQATGFHKSDFLLKHFHTISDQSVSIQATDRNPDLDEGETATLKSKRKSNTLSDTSKLKIGERYNMDIVYGPTVGIGGIKYALLLIDRKSKRKFIYGLKNLKQSILNALRQFLVDTGSPPKVIRTDFDHRLIGGQTRKFLLNKGIKVEAAPPKRQHQNGLVERHWQNIVTMARNWLKSQLLPSSFWFFAVKRAVEIANILPVESSSGIIYTPYERAYKRKVDFRSLFPMFSKAYVKTETEVGGSHLNKFKSQTLKTICVGRCPKSDSLLFYHPPSKTILSNADGYRFDNHTASGPQFGLHYDGGFYIPRKSNTPIHQRPSHEENDTAYLKRNNKYIPVTVLQVPIDEETEFSRFKIRQQAQ